MISNILKRIKIYNAFSSKEEYTKFLKYTAKENGKISRKMALLISIFEILLIFSGAIVNKQSYGEIHLIYTLLYIVALLGCAIFIIIVTWGLKDIESRYKIILKNFVVYNVLILSWSVVVSYLDITLHDHYSLMVIMSAMIGIPLSFYLAPIIIITMNITVSIVMTIMICFSGNVQEIIPYLINYYIFVVMATTIGVIHVFMKIKMYKKNIELVEANCALKNIAERDYLSGLYNRTKLNEVSEKVWIDGIKNNTQLGCILFDIDDFKKINDTYGHIEGDRLIRIISEIIIRTTDDIESYSFRYGGEEFLIVLPGMNSEEAMCLAETIRYKISTLRIYDAEYKISISGGVYSNIPTSKGNIKDFFLQADKGLYRAKENGKNQIVLIN